MADKDIFTQILIFNGLDQKQMTKVKACCQEKDYTAGSRIFADGQQAENLFVVLEGRVDLRFEIPGRESTSSDNITSVRQGQVLGWSALMHSPIYSLSAYCATDKCRLLKVSRDCLLALFEEDPRMGYIVMSHMAEVIRTRFHQVQEELARRKGFPAVRHC
ncbi:MAG: cyclic nucleotide-binding domain-containing protein [Desulfatibacillaceae bacterium]|nr:cyclic nucleotide-binding domain-containing protein [Desulfatibacillaceae bacterium]